MSFNYRAVWISFLEWEHTSFASDAAFSAQFAGMADHCAALGLNTLIVHVRPFSDALYESDIFPASHLLCGRQGKGAGFDPLARMLSIARERGLRLEAWINPYRVLSPARRFALAPQNPAARWLREDEGRAEQRVLPWQDGLYYNPASEEAQDLILRGVRELLQKYPVDGVQIDDYFYPATDPDFDRASWAGQTAQGGLADWRRGNVNRLVAALHRTVRAARPAASFAISPQGSLHTNLRQQYSDVALWMREPGYADCILPQLYWGFDACGGDALPFARTAAEWAALPRHDGLRLYAGLGAYRIGEGDGSPGSRREWSGGQSLARMVRYLRAEHPEYQGFALFRYDSLFGREAHPALRARERQSLSQALRET